MDVKKRFYQEVDSIQNPAIKTFTLRALDRADLGFWTAPCSSSGRFHPQEDQGDQGVLRHLIKASNIIDQLARRSMCSQYVTDLAKSSVLLHDICKDGPHGHWSGETDYRHGIFGAEYLEKCGSIRDKTGKQIILDAVRYHMGPWVTTLSPEKHALKFSKDPEARKKAVFSIEELNAEADEIKRALMPQSLVQKMVQDSDYFASRKEMSFLPGHPIIYDPRVHDTPEEWIEDLKDLSGLK